MSSYAISVSHLSKTFAFPAKDPAKSWVRNVFFPKKTQVQAVHDVSFRVKPGERLAFIGPNGAGKSTTIKMLTGILHPTQGEVRVLGVDPAKDRKKLAYKIGTVFGQRSQLLPNLPLTDSFELFGVMYDLKDKQIKHRTDELVELFDLGSFLHQPVRKLSLGQRMRAEVAASLIHKPKIVFLDEPTIGLDIVAKKALRDLLLNVNDEEGTTIFLTSHDVGDIETLCERTILINHGTIVEDAPTHEFRQRFDREKYVDIIPEQEASAYPGLPEGMRYVHKTPTKITVAVDTETIQLQEALQQLLKLYAVADVDVYSAELESVIRAMYERAANR